MYKYVDNLFLFWIMTHLIFCQEIPIIVFHCMLDFAGKVETVPKVGWGAVWVILLGLVAASVGAYAVYKYRLRVSQKLACCNFHFFPLLEDPCSRELFSRYQRMP